MKGSDDFKAAIEHYLNEKGQSDADFAQHYGKASKNLESCLNYIFGEVKKTGCCAFDNKEIFDMAVRYYTDDSIGVPAPVKCRVEVKNPAENDLFSCPAEVPQSVSSAGGIEASEKPSAAQLAAENHNNMDIQNASVVQSATAVKAAPTETDFSKKVAAAQKPKSNALTLFDL
jgi:hypothetical protein